MATELKEFRFDPPIKAELVDDGWPGAIKEAGRISLAAVALWLAFVAALKAYLVWYLTAK